MKNIFKNKKNISYCLLLCFMVGSSFFTSHATTAFNKQTEKSTVENNNQSVTEKIYNLPVKIETKNPYLKAIILDVFVNKLKSNVKKTIEEKVLGHNDKFKKFDPYVEIDYSLYSILLKDKDKPYIDTYITVKETDKIKILDIIDNAYFKNFIEKFKIDEKAIDEAIKRLEKRINHDKTTLDKNINIIKKDDYGVLDITHCIGEKDINFDEKNKDNEKIQGKKLEIYYDKFLRYMLKEIDKKLYDSIENEFNKTNEPNTFFEKIYRIIKKNNVEMLKNSEDKINKFKLDKFKEYCKSYEKFKNIKLEVNNLKLNTKGREEYPYGIEGIMGYNEFSLEDIFSAFLDSLNLSKNNLVEYKKYYTEKLEGKPELEKLKENRIKNKFAEFAKIKEKNNKDLDNEIKCMINNHYKNSLNYVDYKLNKINNNKEKN